MIVLDASAVVDVLLEQSVGAWVLDELAGQSLVAPAHQPAEVLSALARLVRAGTIDHGYATDALGAFAALDQQFVAPSHAHLTAALAGQHNVRVLDGLYLVLARERGCALLTTDRRLASAATAAAVEARIPPR